MNSGYNADQTLKNSDGNTSVTPSIAILIQKLGASPAPRMLEPSEIDLLR